MQVPSGITSNAGDEIMIIYPSPSSGKFTIMIPGSVKGRFSLNISTPAGTSVMEKKYDPHASGEPLEIRSEKLRSGNVYPLITIK